MNETGVIDTLPSNNIQVYVNERSSEQSSSKETIQVAENSEMKHADLIGILNNNDPYFQKMND